MLALPTGEGTVFINASDIVCCEAKEDSATLFYLLNGNKIVVLLGMKECIHLLSGAGFFLVDDFRLLNIIHVKNKENRQLVLPDGSAIKISRRKKNEFMEFIKDL